MNDEIFVLRNEVVKQPEKRPTFETKSGRQTVLWTGLDLLPGQLDFTEQACTERRDEAERDAATL